MKLLTAVLISLGYLSVYAEEIPIRLTKNNIFSLTLVQGKECRPFESDHGMTYFAADSEVNIKLVDKRTVRIIVSDSMSTYTSIARSREKEECNFIKGIVAKEGRELLNRLNNIKMGDIESERTRDNIVCKKTVGNITYNTETLVGSNFEEKTVIVKCPNN